MKTLQIKKSRRTATFARAAALPILTLALLTKAHCCEYDANYFRSQPIYCPVVQMMPIEPIIEEMHKTEASIKQHQEQENSSTQNMLLVAMEGIQETKEQNGRLEQEITEVKQEVTEVKQEITEVKQQNARLEQMLAQILRKMK